MVVFAIIGIILFVIAFFRKKPKQKERISPMYSWAEKEGYDRQFAYDYIDHLNDLKNKPFETPNIDGLQEEITAIEYYKSTYQHAYGRLKKKDSFKDVLVDSDNCILETDIGRFRLKKIFRGVSIEEIPTDDELKNGVFKTKKEEKDVLADIEY